MTRPLPAEVADCDPPEILLDACFDLDWNHCLSRTFTDQGIDSVPIYDL